MRDLRNHLGRRRDLMAIAALSGLAVLLAACGVPASGSPADGKGSSTGSATAEFSTKTPPTIIRSMCLDTTSSTPREFSVKIRDLLVSSVRSWVKPDEPGPGGSDATPGLDLRVRTVAAGVESNSDLSRHVVIDPVPGLFPIPKDVGSDDYTVKLGRWNEAREGVAAQWEKAKKKADNGVKEIGQLSLGDPGISGIMACASTLALITASGPDRKFLIASDLEENAGGQLGGSFAQAPVTLLQPCPSGSLSRCEQLADAFKGQIGNLQAGPIDIVRPEQADQKISSWLGAQ